MTQIWQLDSCPVISARALDNSRIVKSITEACEILGIVKPHNIYHPLVTWGRSSPGNLLWISRYAEALCNEQHKRFGSTSKNRNAIVAAVKDLSRWAGEYIYTPFNFAKNRELGIDYTHVQDVNEAYWLYFVERMNMCSLLETMKNKPQYPKTHLRSEI